MPKYIRKVHHVHHDGWGHRMSNPCELNVRLKEFESQDVVELRSSSQRALFFRGKPLINRTSTVYQSVDRIRLRTHQTSEVYRSTSGVCWFRIPFGFINPFEVPSCHCASIFVQFLVPSSEEQKQTRFARFPHPNNIVRIRKFDFPNVCDHSPRLFSHDRSSVLCERCAWVLEMQETLV